MVRSEVSYFKTPKGPSRTTKKRSPKSSPFAQSRSLPTLSTAGSTAYLSKQSKSLLDARNSLINNRQRVEKLSISFLAKAKLALETGDEALAKEVLALRETQLQASEDVLLHVDHEKTKLFNLNKSLQDYNETHYSPSYVHDTFPELSPLPARAFPKVRRKVIYRLSPFSPPLTPPTIDPTTKV